MWASTTIRRPLRWKASASGGRRREGKGIQKRSGCSSVRMVEAIGLAITVCHLPPGTSKWNKIEHRLFAWISQNWRGKPLVDYAIIVKLIAATTTEAGLTVQCQLDTNRYPTGRKISDEEMSTLFIVADTFHGEWNYTLFPRTGSIESFIF